MDLAIVQTFTSISIKTYEIAKSSPCSGSCPGDVYVAIEEGGSRNQFLGPSAAGYLISFPSSSFLYSSGLQSYFQSALNRSNPSSSFSTWYQSVKHSITPSKKHRVFAITFPLKGLDQLQCIIF